MTTEVDLDAMFMRELLAKLRQAAGELSIARGRLRTRGHVMARAQIGEAHGYITRVAHDVHGLVQQVWSDAATATALDDVLDVQWTRQALWALAFAGEAIDTARGALRSSARQWVARGHLCDAHGRVSQAHRGLGELSRRAWEE